MQRLLALVLGLAHAAGALSSPPVPQTGGCMPWMNRSMPIPERVAKLLANLTTSEKIAQTWATHTSEKIVDGFARTGVGAVKYMTAFSCEPSPSGMADCVRARNAMQAKFFNNCSSSSSSSSSSGGGGGKTPISFINEGLHGGSPGGTIFPMPVNQGSSWNVSLVASIARAVAAEARAVGVDTVFAPVVNMVMDPRFGRLQEGFSENPLLTTHMGTASVTALQGGASPLSYLPPASVASLGKHFAGYGGAAGGLNGGPLQASKRELFDTYLRPWRSMAAAGVRSVMPAHNTVLDVPCHANKWLIGDVLRDGFGFGSGVALSDCNDIGVLEDYRVAANRSHAAALSLRAGVDWDLQCGTDPSHWSFNTLNQSLDEGLITLSDLDETVARVLTHKFANGLFDEAPTDPAGTAVLDSPAHRALAREGAEQSIVLLKNENGALPLALPPSLKLNNASQGQKRMSIALLGPTASSACNCSEAADSLIGSYALTGAHVVTLDEALDKVDSISHTWAPGMKSAGGPTGTGQDDDELAKAVQLARASDVTILVLGDIQGLHNGGCGEWGDRDDLDLQGGQLELLTAVSKVAKKTIVILVHGRPQTFGKGNAALEGVDALFAAWRPGEEFGSAMVSLLTGQVSPSAKLSLSWPRSVGQVGSGSSPWLQAVRGKWLANQKGDVDAGDGRRYDSYVSSNSAAATPLFYFGYGLSFTTFRYDKVEVVSRRLLPVMTNTPSRRVVTSVGRELWMVNVTVSNTGTAAGAEVVQVYVRDPVGLPFVPAWKRLVGFARLFLQPGETGTASISVSEDDVALYHDDLSEAINTRGRACKANEPPVLTLFGGTYNVTAGGASNAAVLHQLVTV